MILKKYVVSSVYKTSENGNVCLAYLLLEPHNSNISQQSPTQ